MTSTSSTFPFRRDLGNWSDIDLVQAYQSDGADRDLAATELVRRYQGLIRNMAFNAFRHHGKVHEVDDLAQVASMAFLLALAKFDPSEGATIGSFAPFEILSFFRDFDEENRGAVRAPKSSRVRRAAHFIRVLQAHRAARGLPGRLSEADLAAVAKTSGCSMRVVKTARRFVEMEAAGTIPLDAFEEDGGAAGDEEGGYEAALASERAAIVRTLLASDDLTARERFILERKVMMKGEEDEPTNAEVGRALGLSEARVRQIEKEALKKLGALCESRGVVADMV